MSFSCIEQEANNEGDVYQVARPCCSLEASFEDQDSEYKEFLGDTCINLLQRNILKGYSVHPSVQDGLTDNLSAETIISSFQLWGVVCLTGVVRRWRKPFLKANYSHFYIDEIDRLPDAN